MDESDALQGLQCPRRAGRTLAVIRGLEVIRFTDWGDGALRDQPDDAYGESMPMWIAAATETLLPRRDETVNKLCYRFDHRRSGVALDCMPHQALEHEKRTDVDTLLWQSGSASDSVGV